VYTAKRISIDPARVTRLASAPRDELRDRFG